MRNLYARYGEASGVFHKEVSMLRVRTYSTTAAVCRFWYVQIAHRDSTPELEYSHRCDLAFVARNSTQAATIAVATIVNIYIHDQLFPGPSP